MIIELTDKLVVESVGQVDIAAADTPAAAQEMVAYNVVQVVAVLV